MSEIKIEALAGMAREFKDSEFGKHFTDYMDMQIDTLVLSGMNADTSDGQLKGLNQAAGIRILKGYVDQLVYFAEHPESLKNNL